MEAKHIYYCAQHYEGSSGSMEFECALRIWRRSTEEYSLSYTTMLSDGDIKAYGAVCEANHVAEQVGTALKKLASVSKRQKATIAMKGKRTNIKIKNVRT